MALQVANDLGLALRQYFRADVVDAEFAGDALRCATIVAGQRLAV